MENVQRQHVDFPLWNGFLSEATRPLDNDELTRFSNKRILITGAGGYLGSAVARALASLPVAELVLLDHAEYGLYLLDQQWRDSGLTPRAAFIVGSVTDRALLEEIFTRHAPDIVVHAAALKHVPLMQTNALAAAETNILGTAAVVEAAMQAQCERLVFLSTDKAVAPISIMGATKRIAEQIVLHAFSVHPQRCAALRLCNVLGSTGSVAPMFARQIASGQPLTLTHDDATRFFVSETDAVHYILRAAIMPYTTGLLIPKLDQPYRIRDLAEYMLQRYGQRLPLIETGLRSGDKMHEHLVSTLETVEPSSHADMLMVHSAFDYKALADALVTVRKAVQLRDHAAISRAICSAVPDFCSQPSQLHLNHEALV